MRLRTAPLIAAVVVGLGVPAFAQVPSGDDLGHTRDQLERAGRDLAEVERQVQRVGAEVAAADERLRSASTALAGVRAELAEAEAAATAADAAERDAASRLQAATDELNVLVADHTASRDALSDQAIVAFKRGGSLVPEVAFAGIVRAGDLHEVAVTRGVVTRMLGEQHDLVADSAELTRTTAAAHSTVADARRDAIEAASAASAERSRVATLVSDQEALVAEVEAETADRQEALERIEEDAAARAVLVRDLEARVAELEAAAASVLLAPVDVPVDGPVPPWAVALPPAGREWSPAIVAVAGRHGLDPRLLAALVWTESNFRPDAVSHAGATGLAQLMPGTARGLGVDPRDPLGNLDGGARYLVAQLRTFERVDLALAAYNAGPGRVQRAGNAIPAIVETQLYVTRVLERYERLRAVS